MGGRAPRGIDTETCHSACDYIAQHFEGVKVAKPEGTYMLFVDCTDWCAAHGKTIREVEQACWDVGAAVQDGTSVPRSLPPADESGLSPLPHRGSFPPDGSSMFLTQSNF